VPSVAYLNVELSYNMEFCACFVNPPSGVTSLHLFGRCCLVAFKSRAARPPWENCASAAAWASCGPLGAAPKLDVGRSTPMAWLCEFWSDGRFCRGHRQCRKPSPLPGNRSGFPAFSGHGEFVTAARRAAVPKAVAN